MTHKDIETTSQFQQDMADFNDEEIQQKLDSLLTKYQSRRQIATDKNNVVFSDASLSQVDASQTLEEVIENEIPILTEVVTLRSSPLRSILDVALDQTRIEMSLKDREELARALAKQLMESPINFGQKAHG